MNPYDALEKELPPLFFREAVPRLIPGLSARYLANLDSAGKGPAGRIRIGKKIAYPRADFVSWLRSRENQVGTSGTIRKKTEAIDEIEG